MYSYKNTHVKFRREGKSRNSQNIKCGCFGTFSPTVLPREHDTGGEAQEKVVFSHHRRVFSSFRSTHFSDVFIPSRGLLFSIHPFFREEKKREKGDYKKKKGNTRTCQNTITRGALFFPFSHPSISGRLRDVVVAVEKRERGRLAQRHRGRTAYRGGYRVGVLSVLFLFFIIPLSHDSLVCRKHRVRVTRTV